MGLFYGVCHCVNAREFINFQIYKKQRIPLLFYGKGGIMEKNGEVYV